LLEQSVEVAREVGDLWCLADVLGTLASIYPLQGELDAAENAGTEGLRIARANNDDHGMRMASRLQPRARCPSRTRRRFTELVDSSRMTDTTTSTRKRAPSARCPSHATSAIRGRPRLRQTSCEQLTTVSGLRGTHTDPRTRGGRSPRRSRQTPHAAVLIELGARDRASWILIRYSLGLGRSPNHVH